MDINKAIDSIVGQLKQYIGNKKAIVGISGGIDSAVVAYLCVRAIGKDNVIGIVLPYGNQSSEDGFMVANGLGITLCSVNIERMVDSFPKLDADNNQKLTKGNIMARIRMVVLYEYANAYNGLVIGTTNKTEAMIGYYTKYGDGGVDVEPIADLYKTEVWEAAKILGVPQTIIDKKPSAELWDGQTDEDELGMTYEEMDGILTGMNIVRNGFYSDNEILETLYGKGKIKMVSDKIASSEHKRHMPPSFKV